MNVSVVIPTYNRAELLKKSIQSVLDQTVRPMEIIIVDDFSTDHTRDVVESFQNESVKYVKNTRKKGANGARNTGILMAEGEFIAFQDSDDIWLPPKLEMQKSYMEANPEVDMCFCSLNIKNSVRGTVPKRKVLPNEIESQLGRGNFISTQTIFIKSQVAKNLLFDESLRRFQDWDFVLRIARNYSIHHIPEVLVQVEVQEDSISKKINEVEALDQFFTKYPDLKDACMVNKSLNNRILFFNAKQTGRTSKSVEYFLKSVGYKYLDKVVNRGSKL